MAEAGVPAPNPNPVPGNDTVKLTATALDFPYPEVDDYFKLWFDCLGNSSLTCYNDNAVCFRYNKNEKQLTVNNIDLKFDANNQKCVITFKDANDNNKKYELTCTKSAYKILNKLFEGTNRQFNNFPHLYEEIQKSLQKKWKMPDDPIEFVGDNIMKIKLTDFSDAPFILYDINGKHLNYWAWDDNCLVSDTKDAVQYNNKNFDSTCTFSKNGIVTIDCAYNTNDKQHKKVVNGKITYSTVFQNIIDEVSAITGRDPVTIHDIADYFVLNIQPMEMDNNDRVVIKLSNKEHDERKLIYNPNNNTAYYSPVPGTEQPVTGVSFNPDQKTLNFKNNGVELEFKLNDTPGRQTIFECVKNSEESNHLEAIRKYVSAGAKIKHHTTNSGTLNRIKPVGNDNLIIGTADPSTYIVFDSCDINLVINGEPLGKFDNFYCKDGDLFFYNHDKDKLYKFNIGNNLKGQLGVAGFEEDNKLHTIDLKNKLGDTLDNLLKMEEKEKLVKEKNENEENEIEENEEGEDEIEKGIERKKEGIQYIEGKGITITSKDRNLIFSIDENDDNRIVVPIQDFLFGNLDKFEVCDQWDFSHYSLTYYDDALVLTNKNAFERGDEPLSPIIIDFKPMLKEQGLDAEQCPGLDDIKSFLIRIKAAEKKQDQGQQQGQFNENNDDCFLDAEDDIITAIYNNGPANVEKAAAYMELNDYINKYVDQEMNEDEVDAFIKIISLTDDDAVKNAIDKASKNENVNFNKIFVALMYFSEEEQIETFIQVFLEKFVENKQKGNNHDNNGIDMNAILGYEMLVRNLGLEKIKEGFKGIDLSDLIIVQNIEEGKKHKKEFGPLKKYIGSYKIRIPSKVEIESEENKHTMYKKPIVNKKKKKNIYDKTHKKIKSENYRHKPNISSSDLHSNLHF